MLGNKVTKKEKLKNLNVLRRISKQVLKNKIDILRKTFRKYVRGQWKYAIMLIIIGLSWTPVLYLIIIKDKRNKLDLSEIFGHTFWGKKDYVLYEASIVAKSANVGAN